MLRSHASITLLGTAPTKSGVFSFVVKGVHPHDVGTILDEYGVAVRVGHHCTQPLMARLNVPATVRASLSVYNNLDDINRLDTGLKKVKDYFS